MERETRICAKYQGNEVKGLLAAYLLDSFSLSFPFDKNFTENEIHIDIDELMSKDGDTNGGDIKSYIVKVKNVYDLISLTYHQDQYQSMSNYKKEMCNLDSLVEKATRHFPGIEFGPKAFDEMKSQQIAARRFQKIIEKLYLLNHFFQTEVPAGNRDLKTMTNCSAESESTKNKFSEERKFIFNDGVERFCEWHLKLAGINWRIHFMPDFEKQKAYVGYIGEHLRTSRFH